MQGRVTRARKSSVTFNGKQATFMGIEVAEEHGMNLAEQCVQPGPRPAATTHPCSHRALFADSRRWRRREQRRLHQHPHELRYMPGAGPSASRPLTLT